MKFLSQDKISYSKRKQTLKSISNLHKIKFVFTPVPWDYFPSKLTTFKSLSHVLHFCESKLRQ